MKEAYRSKLFSVRLNSTLSILLISIIGCSIMQHDYSLASEKDTLNDAAYDVYVNSTYGIKLIYPTIWHKDDPTNSADQRNVDIVYISAPDSIPFVKVSRDTFNRNETIDTYIAETIQSYASDFKDFTLIRSDTETAALAGKRGYELLYSSTDTQGKLLLTKEIGTIIDAVDVVYYAQYTSYITDYSINERVADRIINSIELHITSENSTEQEEASDLSKLEDLLVFAPEI
jgi:hypothetical protein